MVVDHRTKEQRYNDAVKKAKEVCYKDQFGNESANEILVALVGNSGFRDLLEEYYKKHPTTLAKDIAKETYGVAKEWTAKGFSKAVGFAKKGLK